MRKRSLFLLLTAAAVSSFANAQSIYPGQHRGKIAVENSAPVKAESFDLKEVRLLPGRVRENLERDSAWMVNVSARRMLHSFRNNAGVFAGLEGGYESVNKYGGWESLDCDLLGHTTGHLLSAYGLMYAATGSEIFKFKGDSLVAGLAEVQQALGDKGYLSAFPEELINRNLQGKGVWAPWYTLHKILSGLIDQFLYSGNQQALTIAKGMGDWAYGKLKDRDAETRRRFLGECGESSHIRLGFMQPEGAFLPGRQILEIYQRLYRGIMLHLQHAQAFPSSFQLDGRSRNRRLL